MTGCMPMTGRERLPLTARQTVVVELTEFKFSPHGIWVDSGQVTLRIVNRGDVPHTLTIPSLGLDTGTIDPGRTRTLTAHLAGGTHRIVCMLAGHQEAGMVGTLTVAP